MSEGWICLHRGWRENPLFSGEFSRADAWVWLIENACWKASRSRIKGQIVELNRGELTFSQRFLAEKWGWSKSRVDRFIADLREEGMIETRSKIGASAGHAAGQGQSIITICNYAKYQDVSDDVWVNDNAQSGATAGQQRGKEEQGNKGTSNKDNTHNRARVLPDDWVPEDFGPDSKCRAVMDAWPPGELETQLEHFTAHHRGKGSRFVNWQDAWKTWVLNSRKWSSGNGKQREISRPARNQDGAATALDRQLGLGEFAGQAGRRDAQPGPSDSRRALAAPQPRW